MWRERILASKLMSCASPLDLLGSHPDENLFLFSTQIFVNWMYPIVAKSRQGNLQESDIFEVPKAMTVDKTVQRFWEAWHLEVQKSSNKPNLVAVLFSVFSRDFIFGGIHQIIFMISQISQPYLIGALVDFISTETDSHAYGIGLAFGLAFVSLTSALSYSAGFYALRRCGMALRSTLSMAIYEHSLRLTSKSRLNCSVGQITNFVVIDVEKLFLCVQYLHYLWLAPVVCLLIMLLIIPYVGPESAFSCVGWLLVLFPIQNKMAEYIGNIRKTMIKDTDSRVNFMNEILQAIRVIKLYCWEQLIEQKLLKIRSKEIIQLNKYLHVNSQLREINFLAIPIASIALFAVVVHAEELKITPNIGQVFQLMCFLAIMRFPINIMTQALKSYVDAKTSVDRLTVFFQLSTMSSTEIFYNNNVNIIALSDNNNSINSNTFIDINPEKKQSNEVLLCDATFSWTEKNEESAEGFCLKNLNIKIPEMNSSTHKRNELVAILGVVGSGKSSFLSALLGDMPLLSGSCSKLGKVAYCAQTPWIQNQSLRANILFGLDADKDAELQTAYDAAVSAACLLPDISILPNGDMTEIGEKGINLSGGQKSRVSIARALLASQTTQFVILDDPLSAVDDNTGNWIFKHGVLDILKSKLRIIVMNSHMHLIRQFDRVIVLDGGRVVADGSPQHLIDNHLNLLSSVTGLSPESWLVAKGDAGADPTEKASPDTRVRSLQKARADFIPVVALPASPATATDVITPTTAKPSSQLIQSEARASGSIEKSVYINYFGSVVTKLKPTEWYNDSTMKQIQENTSRKSFIFGFIISSSMLFLFIAAQFARITFDYFLVAWAMSEPIDDAHHYLFTCFSLLAVLVLFRSLIFTSLTIQIAKNIHKSLLRSVLSASIPLFFDTHTTGAILNRFAKDTEAMDGSVPEFLLQMVINWLQTISIFCICIWASYWFILIILPLSFIFYNLYVMFASVSRDLKRLESVSRSPIYSSLSETLSGLETIRAYKENNRFLANHMKKLARNHRLFYSLWMAQSYVTVRLEAVTPIIMLVVTLMAIFIHKSDVQLGLSLTYVLQLTALFQRCIQLTIDVSTYMTSTERIMEYCDEIPHEISVIPKSNTISNIQSAVTVVLPPQELTSDWPAKGTIVFENVVMQYRNNPPVLKGLSFTCTGGQRVGICGRTGSGKTSVMMSLFRVVELTSGVIAIDGLDISSIPITSLRKKLAIIPQDPILFTGSIRFQIDPFSEHSDVTVWEMLEKVNMAETVRQMKGGLLAEVLDNGGNLSQGQRQLLCIARALTRKARILVMDEGTSAVDPYTDNKIQEVLQIDATYNGTTVLTIAHRLQTIINFDKILVLGDGQVLEYDTPEALLAKESSCFSQMVRECQK